jgi:hypothetical protein
MIRLSLEDKNFNDKYCLKIVWNDYCPFYLDNLISYSNGSLSTIIDDINSRKNKITSKFQYFYKGENNSVEDLERIIHIKMKILEMRKEENIFNEIIECYQKIIEIYTIYNDDGHEIYIKKLHELIKKYDGKIIK